MTTEELAAINVDMLDDQGLALYREVMRRNLSLDPTDYDMTRWVNDPVGYSANVIKQKIYFRQAQILNALARPFAKVFVQGSHATGKSRTVSTAVWWKYDCQYPSNILCTGPNEGSVEDITFKEIRKMRPGHPDLYPMSSRIERRDGSRPEHFATAHVVRKGESFQGKHELNGLIVVEEAVAFEQEMIDSAHGMLNAPGWGILAACNPTDPTCAFYDEVNSNDEWVVISMDAREHPNIVAQLRGEAKPFPSAISLEWFEWALRTHCSVIDPRKIKPGDGSFPWPYPNPNELTWYKPDPWFEGRVLARWPSNSTINIWNEAMWEACLIQRREPDKIMEIGCDVARFGDDNTAIYVQRGGCYLHSEHHNGWEYDQTAERLRELANQWGRHAGMDGREVPVKVDETGNGVVSHKAGYNFIGINSSEVALDPTTYVKRRSELWFTTANLAKEGLIDVSRLSTESQRRLRGQLMSVRYKVDGSNRFAVEEKSRTKSRLKGKSPDDADAFNLAMAAARSGDTDYSSVRISAAVGSQLPTGELWLPPAYRKEEW